MPTLDRYVVGTWVQVTNEDGSVANEMSLSLDHPELLSVVDATDQAGNLIADGHQCVCRVTGTPAQIDDLQADNRYTVFPVEGEVTATDKLALKKYDNSVEKLPAGAKREDIKQIIVAKFRLQGRRRIYRCRASARDRTMTAEPSGDSDAHPAVRDSSGGEQKSAGLGDTIEKITRRLGLRPCQRCRERRRRLNTLLPYSKTTQDASPK